MSTRVLIVEDDKFKADDLKKEIASDCDVTIVASVRDAVVTVFDEVFDVIILDMALPTFTADSSSLMRKFHRFTAADADLPIFAALNAVRVLDVLSSTPARPNSRSPCENRHLHALASRIGEIFALSGTAQPQGGVEVLRALKSTQLGTPVVIVSQYPDLEIDGVFHSLDAAPTVLSERYGIDVVGAVVYDFQDRGWSNEFRKLISRPQE